jgi:hypothetical protein
MRKKDLAARLAQIQALVAGLEPGSPELEVALEDFLR